MRAVGKGVQAASLPAAQPAMDGLAADAVALGHLGHREPVTQHFHDGVEALLCHRELQEHAPDLLASPLVGEAQAGRAVVSTINRNAGTHQPVSSSQVSAGSAQLSGARRARDLPETALRATSPSPTTRPSTALLTCATVWAREVLRGIVNSPRIDGKDGVAGSIPAGGSTTEQQVRPGPAPGLSHTRSGATRHLPEICQKPQYAVVRAPIVTNGPEWTPMPPPRCAHARGASNAPRGGSVALRGVGTSSRCTAVLGRYGSSVERDGA
jgi:hypothetical protein